MQKKWKDDVMETENSPNAWIVPVSTARLGGGRPMVVYYMAGGLDASDAIEAVRKHIEALEGDEIREPSPVSDAAAEAFGVTKGIVKML